MYNNYYYEYLSISALPDTDTCIYNGINLTLNTFYQQYKDGTRGIRKKPNLPDFFLYVNYFSITAIIYKHLSALPDTDTFIDNGINLTFNIFIKKYKDGTIGIKKDLFAGICKCVNYQV